MHIKQNYNTCLHCPQFAALPVLQLYSYAIWKQAHLCTCQFLVSYCRHNKKHPKTLQNLLHTLARAVKWCASTAVWDFGCNSNVHCRLFFNYKKLQFLTLRGIPSPKFRYYIQWRKHPASVWEQAVRASTEEWRNYTCSNVIHHPHSVFIA